MYLGSAISGDTMGDTFPSKKLKNSINLPSILHLGSSEIRLFFLWSRMYFGGITQPIPSHNKKMEPLNSEKISVFLPNLPSKSFELLLKIP